MNNEGYIEHPLINNYLKKLSNQLRSLPKSEREQQLLELEEHLQASVLDKIQQGKNEEIAVKETLEEFSHPNDLAAQINTEYKNHKEEQFGENNGFKVGTGLLFAGFGLTAVPIFRGELGEAQLTLGLLAVVVIIGWLLSPLVRWNGERLEHLKMMGKIVIKFILPLGAASFIIRSFIDGQPNIFSFSLFIGYTIIAVIIYRLFKYLYNTKKEIL